MKNDLQAIERDQALRTLLSDFERRRPFNQKSIREIHDTLNSSEEISGSGTLAQMKARSLAGQGRYHEAYLEFHTAIKKDPFDLSLQLELPYLLDLLSDQFNELLHDDPHHPSLELFYEALMREGKIGIESQGRYLRYLIFRNKYAEAAKLATPLVALFPALVGLKEAVSEIAVHVPAPALHGYLQKTRSLINRPTIKSQFTAQQILELKRKFFIVQEMMENDLAGQEVTAILNETVGEISETSPIDLSIRDFYYYKAIHLVKNNKPWESILLSASLVEIDPCNMHYRKGLQKAIQSFFYHIHESYKQHDFTIDAGKARALIADLSSYDFRFIGLAAQSEIKAGRGPEAQKLMRQMLSLNPLSTNYLIASLDVAVLSGDAAWIEEVLRQMMEASRLRTHDLALRARIDDLRN